MDARTIASRLYPILLLVQTNGLSDENELSHLITTGRPFIFSGEPRPLGIASDGSNCFALLDSGSIGFMRIDPPDAATLGTHGQAPFPSQGGMSRITTGAGGWVAAWAENATNSARIYGSSYDTERRLIGEETNQADVTEVISAGTNYLVLWEVVDSNRTWSATFRGRFLTSQREPAHWLTLSSSNTANRRFPAATVIAENVMLAWVEETATSNWHVKAARCDAYGQLTAPVTISELPATTPNPIDLCHDGTNLFAVWSRDAGPYGPQTNLWYPMLLGRRFTMDLSPLGSEFQVSRAKGGQFAPSLVYNGNHYLLLWSEPSFGPYYTQRGRAITASGEMLAHELPRFEAGSFLGTPLCVFRDAYVVLHYSPPNSNQWVRAWGRYLHEPQIGHLLRNPVLRTNQTIAVELVGPSTNGYMFQSSMDNVTWERLIFGPYSSGLVRPGRVELPLREGISLCFFRAVDHRYSCIRNLQAIQQAKVRWVLDTDRTSVDVPQDTDLFGPGKYLDPPPVCPVGGTYWFYNVGTRATCSYFAWGHSIEPPY